MADEKQKFTREMFTKAMASLDEQLELAKKLMVEAADPAGERKEVFGHGADAYSHLVAARHALRSAFSAFGVRPA